MTFPLVAILPIAMLLASNIFMTLAWYGHLKYPHAPITLVILASWGIALLEYCLAVPANRIGYGYYTATELKTIQEVITLMVFIGFSILYLGEKITFQHLLGFAVIAVGGYLVFSAPK
ncbi:MAG: hypothetical protein DI585_04585 [Pseudomonas fluorescens]|nr:MAG: hypothetical protein DI585_04585 [Pseudomonas fluorescens]